MKHRLLASVLLVLSLSCSVPEEADPNLECDSLQRAALTHEFLGAWLEGDLARAEEYLDPTDHEWVSITIAEEDAATDHFVSYSTEEFGQTAWPIGRFDVSAVPVTNCDAVDAGFEADLVGRDELMVGKTALGEPGKFIVVSVAVNS